MTHTTVFPDLISFLDTHQQLRQDLKVVVSQEHHKTGEPLRFLLTRLGFVKECDLIGLLDQVTGVPHVTYTDLRDISVWSTAGTALLAASLAPRADVAPGYCLLVTDPFAHGDIDFLAGALPPAGREQQVVPRYLIDEKTFHYLHKTHRMQKKVHGLGDFRSFAEPDQAPNPEHLVNSVLEAAITAQASDVHFNVYDAHIRIKQRCCGVLKDVLSFHISDWPRMLSHLKVRSGMNMSAHMVPQTGRFSYPFLGRTVDCRCSSHPTALGENFVIRVLDRLESLRTLEELGFQEGSVSRIYPILREKAGMIVVTGPTGSGKTTTLYAMLAELVQHQLNIMTLEDPIEYTLPGVQQSQINPERDFNFAEGVRSILRQDPDVILVGEIRDEETARMALRAAMTGHLVLTTLHTTDALHVPQRFMDLGVPPALLSGNLIAMMAQRLVPRFSGDYGAPEKRTAIAEIVTVDAALDRMIAEGQSYAELKDYVQKQGVALLADHSLERFTSPVPMVDNRQAG